MSTNSKSREHLAHIASKGRLNKRVWPAGAGYWIHVEEMPVLELGTVGHKDTQLSEQYTITRQRYDDGTWGYSYDAGGTCGGRTSVASCREHAVAECRRKLKARAAHYRDKETLKKALHTLISKS